MMRHHGLIAALVLGTLGLSAAAAADPPKRKISWKKTVLDKSFRSEGVAVADINKDGKADVIVGDVWYEAPNWKLHVIRQDRTFKPAEGYSQCFGCFADDFNGDGWADVLIIPFPGAPCYWYENPRNTGDKWKEHMISHSACNETPLFADLFGNGKRVLIMGVQPKGQENMGQMFWLRPGKDPYQPWEHHAVSVPSEKGKVVPGTFRFSHGLGVGDVNGDGRNDVICTAGWWEQPAERDAASQPWKFHAADLEPACADMYAIDIDGDGRNDVLSTSAHQFGMWWHQQKGSKENPTFIRNEMFLGAAVANDKRNLLIQQDEKQLLDRINNYRGTKNLRPVRAVPALCAIARKAATSEMTALKMPRALFMAQGGGDSVASLFQVWIKSPEKEKLLLSDWQEAGIAVTTKDGKSRITAVLVKGNTPLAKGIVVWENMKKQFISQTHALHLVDINGDGIKDLVTGRRFWAHGPHGDAAPTEPAFLFWFEGRRGKDGMLTFVPRLIDDDSGVGTQFAVNDVNGDGLLDVIISNKKGVFVFEQVREPARKE